jgi:hypothetical protein
MKSFSFLLALLLASVLFIACEGDIGPKGPTGDVGAAGVAGAKGDKGAKGDTGAAGANGNNEVLTFDGPSAVLAAGTSSTFRWSMLYQTVPREKAVASAIYVYVKLPRNPEEWVSVPGSVFFPNGSYQTLGLRTRFTDTATVVEVFRSEGTGELAISASKLVFVPRSVNGRQTAIDYSDYEAVKKHYNLAD